MKATHYLSLLTGLALAASAQSIDSLNHQPEDPSAPNAEPTAATQEQDTEGTPLEPATPAPDPELINEPSRYAGIDIEAYIHAVSSTFSMRNRERDPFGRYQDPNYKPPVPKAAPRTIAKYKPAPVTPFSDIVAAIPITTIIAGQSKFLVKDRSFRTGDQIKLKTSGGKVITVHVVSVASDRVKFRHGTTNETAEQSLHLLPGGMQRGGGSILPRGLTDPNDQAPIDISGSGAGTSLSSSR